MTAVPKPLKFLRPHYDLLKSVYEKLPEGDNKVPLSLCASMLNLAFHFLYSMFRFYTHFCRNRFADRSLLPLHVSSTQKSLADVVSILAMTMAAEGTRESLHYKLKGNSGDIGSWGHEYVRYNTHLLASSRRLSRRSLVVLVLTVLAPATHTHTHTTQQSGG
jgi:26S proteasome regulatory subunit N1